MLPGDQKKFQKSVNDSVVVQAKHCFPDEVDQVDPAQYNPLAPPDQYNPLLPQYRFYDLGGGGGGGGGGRGSGPARQA